MEATATDTINILRSIVTLLAFIAFIGIVAWAWSGRRRKSFAEAAQIPFEEDGVQHMAGPQGSKNTEKGNTDKTGTERSGQ